MSNTSIKTFIFLVLSPVFALLMLIVHWGYLLFIWTPYSQDQWNAQPEENRQIFIPKGESFIGILNQLEEKKLIPKRKLFYYLVKYQDKLEKFRAGLFQLPQIPLTAYELLHFLLTAPSIQMKVTIPEGKNFYEIFKTLKEKKLFHEHQYQEWVQLMKNPNLFFHLPFFQKYYPKTNTDHFSLESIQNLDGYIFPDTYFFHPPLGPNDLITHSLQNMDMIFQKINAQTLFHPEFFVFEIQHSSKIKLNTHQLLTLASIVEKETGAAWERPIIAGVFLNRLNLKMKLQSDPTIIYGLYPNWNGNISKKDILHPTPYNTYVISGLPPGPISTVSQEAIKSVLWPQEHSYLYFVSKNDGTHIFSRTYLEHQKAVRHFQFIKQNREGKSWRQLDKNAKTQIQD